MDNTWAEDEAPSITNATLKAPLACFPASPPDPFFRLTLIVPLAPAWQKFVIVSPFFVLFCFFYDLVRKFMPSDSLG